VTEIFLTPGAPPQFFLQGKWAGQMSRRFTKADASHFVGSIVPRDLRARIDDVGIMFDFQYRDFMVRAYVSRSGDSYRLHMQLKEMDQAEHGHGQ